MASKIARDKTKARVYIGATEIVLKIADVP